MDCRWIQNWLYDYLNIDVDPYDFNHYLPQWIEQEEIDIGDEDPEELTVDELTEAQLKAFTHWLKNSYAISSYLESDPFDAPAYLTLHAREKLSKGSWLVHFSRESFVGGFDRGTSLRGLHLSTWRTNKELADCSRNLDEENIGTGEVIFGFAFDVTRRNVLSYGRHRYGSKIVIFQCDCAVDAYHDGDEEYQAIFPICSEHNVIGVYGSEYDQLLVETVGGSEIEFHSLEEIIEYAEKDKRRRRDNRLKRMKP